MFDSFLLFASFASISSGLKWTHNLPSGTKGYSGPICYCDFEIDESKTKCQFVLEFKCSISAIIQATLIPQLSGQQPKQTIHHRGYWPYPWCHSRRSMPLGLEEGIPSQLIQLNDKWKFQSGKADVRIQTINKRLVNLLFFTSTINKGPVSRAPGCTEASNFSTNCTTLVFTLSISLMCVASFWTCRGQK